MDREENIIPNFAPEVVDAFTALKTEFKIVNNSLSRL